MNPLPSVRYDPAIHLEVRCGTAYDFSPLELVAHDPDAASINLGGSIWSSRAHIRPQGRLGLTADGRDGFTTKATMERAIDDYINGLSNKKQAKALISEELYDRVFEVLLAPYNYELEDPQFRWWVRQTFTLQVIDDNVAAIHHDGKPTVCREQIYDVLVAGHARSHHGGRDKTAKVVNSYYSWLPKEMTARFVSLCVGCAAWEKRDDAYFAGMDDGKDYPVHNDLRALSIAAGHADESTYSDVGDHQPVLPPGMTSRRRRPRQPAPPPSVVPAPAETSTSGRVRRATARARSTPYARPSTSQAPTRASSARAIQASSSSARGQSFPPYPENPHRSAAGAPPNQLLAQTAPSAVTGAVSAASAVPTVGPYPTAPLATSSLATNFLPMNGLPSIARALPTNVVTSVGAGAFPLPTFHPFPQPHFPVAARPGRFPSVVDAASASKGVFASVSGVDPAMPNLATGVSLDTSGQRMVLPKLQTAPVPAPASAAVPAPAPTVYGAAMTESQMVDIILKTASTVGADHHRPSLVGTGLSLKAPRPSPLNAQLVSGCSAPPVDDGPGWMERTVELTDAVFNHLGLPLIGLENQKLAQGADETKLLSQILATLDDPAHRPQSAVQRVVNEQVLGQGMDVDRAASSPSLPSSSSPSARSSSRSPSSELVAAGGQAMVPDLSWASSTTDASFLDRNAASVPDTHSRDVATVEENNDGGVLADLLRLDAHHFSDQNRQEGYGTRPSSPMDEWEGPSGDLTEDMSEAEREVYGLV